MIHTTLQIFYTCATCGVTDKRLTVRSRHTDEDVVTWMNEIGAKAWADHWREYPTCPATTMSNLKIPIPDKPNAFLGETTPPGPVPDLPPDPTSKH